jgi:hypothetical protein
MLTMGLKKTNGQKVLCFTCTQCKKKEVIDFRFHPMCKKCNKTNTKLRKRELEKKKKEENS